MTVIEEKETGEDKLTEESSGISSSRSSLPCEAKQLQDELSCPICLEILFEPSTTSCGHSFCRKCLISAANKWAERCPICRWPTSNGRFCTVNTVLWNIIQLLFPQEVEARKAAGALSSQEAELQSQVIEFRNRCNLDNLSNQRARASVPSSRDIGVRRRRAISRQGEDAELHKNGRAISRQGGEEVEARKAAGALNSREAELQSQVMDFDDISNLIAQLSSSRDIGVRRRRAISRQGEGAELPNNVRAISSQGGEEVEARKAPGALNSREAEHESLLKELDYLSNQRAQAPAPSSRDIGVRRRRAISRQGEDAELHNNVRAISSQGGEEVKARKAPGALNSQEAELESLLKELDYLSNQRAQASASSSRDIGVRRRGAISRQGQDAELRDNARAISSQGGEEVKARKAPGALNSREAEHESLLKELDYLSNQRAQASASSSRDIGVRRRRAISRQGEDAELHNNVRRAGRDVGASSRVLPNQDEDAALAQMLQEEEFMMEAFGGTDEQSSRSLSSARANFKDHGI